MTTKPTLYVLAGVNGAGKSSVGGYLLEQAGLSWYNPDAFARDLIHTRSLSQQEANALAWQEGMRQLDHSIQRLYPFAFETTLGGNTVSAKIRTACDSHAVRMWYCALGSPEQHIARVKRRAAHGGHDIAAEKIYERWETSRANLIGLLPYLTELSVLDNSVTAAAGQAIPEPCLILHFKEGKRLYPSQPDVLASTPDWAHAIMERALELDDFKR